MQTKDISIIDRIGIIFLYSAPAASVGFYCLLNHETAIDAFSNIVLALILAGIYFTFLHVNQGYFYQKISHKLLYFISFFLSFVFLGLATGLPVGLLWLAAVVVAALDGGVELAVATHFALMVQYASLLLPKDNGFYRFSGCILFGMVTALLFSLLKGLDAIFYLALILLACDGILQFVTCRFNLSVLQKHWLEAMIEVGSVLALVLFGGFYIKKCGARQWKPEHGFFPGKEEQAEESKEEMPEPTPKEQELFIEEGKQPEQESIEAKQLEILASSDYGLMLRLKEYSEELFSHSLKIGELSGQAALAVGGDEMLARAGGLYHEIGRMEDGNDYIEAGIRIGREYGFPENLLAVMRQHSTGFELPKSMEAAIVMLSDCIVSTSEYLVKNGRRELLSDEQLVNSIFQNRLEKGNLKYAGMTTEQIQDLLEFYIGNAFVHTAQK